MSTNMTKDEINAIFPKVAETMADALGCDVEKVKIDASWIDDLGAAFTERDLTPGDDHHGDDLVRPL